jgi:excinuclease ABC subunit C
MHHDLTHVPTNPGVYLFRDRKEKVLYVGKAKNLKNRLRSYFQQSADLDQRKARMVRLIRDFSFIATDNELEAFILEATLIKQHKPPYNIVLRDDKSYPYIRVTTTEQWPTIQVVRRISKDGNLYFGPYVPAQAMWEAIDFIRRTFAIRTCKQQLDKPMRPCIQYQIKRCSAPCAGLIDPVSYRKIVDEVILFLKGQRQGLLSSIEQRMHKLAEALQFEEAARLRDRLSMLNRAFEAQKVISPELGDLDVIGLHSDKAEPWSPIAVAILFIRNGVLIGMRDYVIDQPVSARRADILREVIQNFYAKNILPPPLIIVSTLPDSLSVLTRWLSGLRDDRVSIKRAPDGKPQELIAMAEENARIASLRKARSIADDLPVEIQERFSLSRAPESIGAFDISTIQGSESVGAFVFLKHGEFVKSKYRHLRIKGTSGIDDYAMMRETIERVVMNLDEDIPDLLIIDGGAGQLAVALRVFAELGITRDIVGLAKRPDRIFLSDGSAIDISDSSRSSLLLRKIRDEVHRFAITYHRKLRDKRLGESLLEQIAGVGKHRRLDLLRVFGGISNIRNASVDDIMKVKGISRVLAERILDYLHTKEKQ